MVFVSSENWGPLQEVDFLWIFHKTMQNGDLDFEKYPCVPQSDRLVHLALLLEAARCENGGVNLKGLRGARRVFRGKRPLVSLRKTKLGGPSSSFRIQKAPLKTECAFPPLPKYFEPRGAVGPF